MFTKVPQLGKVIELDLNPGSPALILPFSSEKVDGYLLTIIMKVVEDAMGACGRISYHCRGGGDFQMHHRRAAYSVSCC